MITKQMTVFICKEWQFVLNKIVNCQEYHEHNCIYFPLVWSTKRSFIDHLYILQQKNVQKQSKSAGTKIRPYPVPGIKNTCRASKLLYESDMKLKRYFMTIYTGSKGFFLFGTMYDFLNLRWIEVKLCEIIISIPLNTTCHWILNF